MYVCMYVYVCMCVYECMYYVYMYVSMYVCMFTYMYFFSYGSTALYGPRPPRFVEVSWSHGHRTATRIGLAYMYICTYLCMYICMCVCRPKYVYICMCMYVYMNVRTYFYMYVRTSVYVQSVFHVACNIDGNVNTFLNTLEVVSNSKRFLKCPQSTAVLLNIL
jgi:hypothetical protein